MKAVILRKRGREKKEYMRVGASNYWTPHLHRARVFSQVGHAKNSIRQLIEMGKAGDYTYYVQRVDVRPVEGGPLEEYVHSKHAETW